MGATFSRVQRLLGDRNVTLISVSVDPATDTPQRLDAWSKKLDARPGWTLVTGEKPEIDRLLKSLGVFTPSRETHTPTVLVGDARSGRWQRASGFATPATIVSLIDNVTQNGDHPQIQHGSEK
jgi:protein SCO1/2